MNRKLIILDIVLGAGVIFGAFQLHSEWAAARARRAGMPGPPPKAAPVPPMTPLPHESAVLASGYKDVAVKDLFDASRNPDLPVPEPPKPAPPPVPPPLPSYHGMMDFGDPQGPVALITQHDTPGHEEVHAGEKVGAFKLVAFNRQEMTLDWEGQVIHARLNEGGSQQAKPKAQPTGLELPLNGVIPGQAAPQAEQPKPQAAELGPGKEITDTVKGCQPGDSSAAGTVSDGYRKELNSSPMGTQCLWRAVGK